jgi:NADPH-dependent 2,4-dienoyl-CoA reductase/sulfur reductase-like enzyme
MMRRHKKASGVFAADDHLRSQDCADMVIVGNGIAGLSAALEARRLAPGKSIAIVTDQSHPTINTPALKQFAFGKLMQEQLLAYPAGTERAQRIEVINARVEEISSKGKFVSLNDGSIFGYDSLLLATGSKPNGLPAEVHGRAFDGVLTLHRLDDYLDLRRRLRLREVRETVVIGGGTHAMETVIGLLRGGIHVYWLLRGATFLPGMLDSAASEMVLEQSRRAGARVLTETEVVGILGRVGSVAGVVTNHRQTIPCQAVLVCTGIAPVTTLAESCDVPLEHTRGIVVDDHLRTNVRDIYAAGDAAALWNPRTGAHEPRAQWHAAAAQGRVAAAVMAGCPEVASSFGVPWHMTRLGELSLLTVGDPLHELDGATTLIDRKKGEYRILSMRDERLTGYLSLGITQPDGLAIKRLVDEELPVRDVASALLKGEFDARQYFAQHHAHTAHRMAVTGKLTVPNTPRPLFQALPETESRRITEPLLHAPSLGDGNDADPLQKRVDRLLSKARLDILDVLHEHDRPMKSKEIASALGKQDDTIRRMLYKMKASHLIEETAQGYRALVPAEERARRAANGHDLEYARDVDVDKAENDAERARPQNITLFQRPLPGVKRAARAIHNREELPTTSVSNAPALVLEQG